MRRAAILFGIVLTIILVKNIVMSAASFSLLDRPYESVLLGY